MDETDATPKDNICPYLQEILDDINARSEWNTKDDTIIEYRMGKRGRKNYPYKGAPNPIVNILDDVTSQKTDAEISMQMNAPRLANFVPLSSDCPTDIAFKAAQGFDTYLRHVLRFRMKKETLTDTKNLRGFSVSKVIRTEHPRFGLIPDFEPVDPKDVIVPVDTKVPVSRKAERMAFILRLSKRELKGKKSRGWNHISEVLDRLSSDTKSDSYSSDSTHDEQSALKVKQRMIGINTSDYAHNTIIFYEVFHYATEWDVKQSKNGTLKEGEKCVSYVCPDVPEFAMKVIPWKIKEIVQMSPEEAMNETINARGEGRDPQTVKIVYKDEKPWPGIQNRAENKSLDWYDTWGVGHKCLDNHLIATRLKKKKLIWTDYISNPMYEDDGSGDNELNFMPGPGKSLPKGKSFAQLPNTPGQIDFDIDAEKRDASQRAGAGQSMYSSEVSSRRKLEKTATQVQSENAQNALMSSASVDRFNDPDVDMYEMLWEDLKELQVELPIIHNDKFGGFMPLEVYNYDFMIIPATSQKHLNPELQFQSNMQAFQFATGYMEQTPMRIHEGLEYILSGRDPFFADILLQDPKEKGAGGEPPVYVLLEQILNMIKQMGADGQQRDKEIEAGLKLAEENSDSIMKIQEDEDAKPV